MMGKAWQQFRSNTEKQPNSIEWRKLLSVKEHRISELSQANNKMGLELNDITRHN